VLCCCCRTFSLAHLPTQDVKFFLHNHLRFNILYNRDAATDLSRVVGFEVEAFSVKHEYDKPWDAKNPTMTTCNPARMIAVSHSLPPQPVDEGAEVVFTYDVKWSVSHTLHSDYVDTGYRK
jgi:transmembrane 9 superfamily protein 2/4